MSELHPTADKNDAPPPSRPTQWRRGMAAALSAVLVSSVILLMSPHVGVALTLVVPFILATILAALSDRKTAWGAVVHPLVTCFIACTLGFFGLIGGVCTVGAILTWLPPAFIGAQLGYVSRATWLGALLVSRWGVCLFLVPLAWGAAEGSRPLDRHLVQQRSVRMFDASPDAVWSSLVTYERVSINRPLGLVRLFPRPVQVDGRPERVGDEQRCRYEEGFVHKRTTVWKPSRCYRFEVTDHNFGFERSATLSWGGFELEERPSGGTQLTLTTSYDAHLRPRFAWALVEWWIVSEFHAFILDGIENEVRKENGTGARLSLRR